MEKLDYQEILAKLQALDDQLRGLGLNQHDRLRVHQSNIAQLISVQEKGTLEQFSTDLAGEKRREILWSLIESIEFVEAMEALQRQGCHVPKELLERAISGPADLFNETPNSNQGRNAMFEISLAGRIAHGGLRPTIGGEPDVLFDFQKRRILVQCKRVMSREAVGKRLLEGGKQLRRDLTNSCNPLDCGVIAISVSRILNQGDKMLVIQTEADIRKVIGAEIDLLIKELQPTLRQVKDPRVAGVLFQVTTPAFVEQNNMFTMARSATICHIEGKSDDALLRSLTRVIQM